ncbi:transposase [Acetobacter tropicalis]|uniref:Transposase n=1 Tax=Acetobacter tropicalis TaxID=104102 RepID=A0A149U5J0_9PROT|nr:transposase [Acetobacter tropicalis]
MKQPGFFDVEKRLARLSGLGDQLEAFSRTVDFEVFRPDLKKALAYSDGNKGGHPPFDPVLVFKIRNHPAEHPRPVALLRLFR